MRISFLKRKPLPPSPPKLATLSNVGFNLQSKISIFLPKIQLKPLTVVFSFRNENLILSECMSQDFGFTGVLKKHTQKPSKCASLA